VVAGAFVLLNVVPPRDLYGSVDWPVVVLLAALIPMGDALSTTGTTTVVVNAFLGMQVGWPPALVLTTLMILTMMLTDVINNAATAVVMAPMAIATASGLGVSADPFLMAVAVGSSCAFLTPIGHQNNTLILGAGGYAFGDYWRMGLPLEILIVLIAVPMILWVWPF
jgi:di/tricarboxylate transporter